MLPPQVPGDLPEAGSLREQLLDQSMMRPAALRNRTLRLVKDVTGLGARRGGLLDQTCFVLGDQALDRSGEILPKVEAVGDLHRLGCSRPGAFGIRTCPVPADYVRRFVPEQPLSQW